MHACMHSCCVAFPPFESVRCGLAPMEKKRKKKSRSFRSSTKATALCILPFLSFPISIQSIRSSLHPHLGCQQGSRGREHAVLVFDFLSPTLPLFYIIYYSYYRERT